LPVILYAALSCTLSAAGLFHDKLVKYPAGAGPVEPLDAPIADQTSMREQAVKCDCIAHLSPHALIKMGTTIRASGTPTHKTPMT
tara:strand:+ start:1675 stop:1929 length:255 start_codon:yes stop_codon:yes gene_type:complete